MYIFARSHTGRHSYLHFKDIYIIFICKCCTEFNTRVTEVTLFKQGMSKWPKYLSINIVCSQILNSNDQKGVTDQYLRLNNKSIWLTNLSLLLQRLLSQSRTV